MTPQLAIALAVCTPGAVLVAAIVADIARDVWRIDGAELAERARASVAWLRSLPSRMRRRAAAEPPPWGPPYPVEAGPFWACGVAEPPTTQLPVVANGHVPVAIEARQ